MDANHVNTFYWPLIAVMSGGILKSEGLDAAWSVTPRGGSTLGALVDGSADLVPSAPGQGFLSLNKRSMSPRSRFRQSCRLSS